MTEQIHNRLSLFRARSGHVAPRAGEQVGVNPQTIGCLERGDYSPSLELAMRSRACSACRWKPVLVRAIRVGRHADPAGQGGEAMIFYRSAASDGSVAGPIDPHSCVLTTVARVRLPRRCAGPPLQAPRAAGGSMFGLIAGLRPDPARADRRDAVMGMRCSALSGGIHAADEMTHAAAAQGA
jgi:DNA-binding XRE family transcriptional regulator